MFWVSVRGGVFLIVSTGGCCWTSGGGVIGVTVLVLNLSRIVLSGAEVRLSFDISIPGIGLFGAEVRLSFDISIPDTGLFGVEVRLSFDISIPDLGLFELKSIPNFSNGLFLGVGLKKLLGIIFLLNVKNKVFNYVYYN
jgi:hypothetical protein